MEIPSARLDVLKRLTEHLQGITPQNGYEYDLTNAVMRGRMVYGQGDPLPMLSLLESPNDSQTYFAAENDSEQFTRWDLMLQGWVVDDVDNPTDPAYLFLAAVQHRLARLTAVDEDSGNPLFPDEFMLGKTICLLRAPAGIVRPPMEQLSSKAFFYLPVQVALVRENG